MKKVTGTMERVNRIASHYVGNDCVQIMIPYQKAITVLSQDGILLHDMVGSSVYINKYLEDERRKNFPYSNIPVYHTKDGLFATCSHANQLFEFEKPYIRISDGAICESFVVKYNNQALLINSVMQNEKHTEHMTYDELLKFIEKKDGDEQTYYVYLDGSMPPNNEGIYPSEEKISDYIKEQLNKNVKDFRELQQKQPDTNVSIYLRQNPWFLNYIEAAIKNLDLSLIDFNLGLGYNSTLLVVRINDGNINIQGVEVTFVRKDDLKVDIYDIPVKKYVLEQLRFALKVKNLKEPRIPLKLNPGITKKDIQEAKQMVKTLKTYHL